MPIPIHILDDNVTGSTYSPNTSNATTIITQPACLRILYMTIAGSHVEVWDVMLFIPNFLFLLFLLFKSRAAIDRLQRTNSPIFTALFVLVLLAQFISIIRCIVSMSVHSALYTNIPDRIMWLVLKFFLLATELSVVIFGLLFGHLDSRTSIERVIIVTFLISLIYSGTQGVLEFYYSNFAFHNIRDGMKNYTLFGHGGMIFWFVSSVCLFLVYSIIWILPATPLRNSFIFPTKKSFYWYCLILAALNATQATGSMLLYEKIQNGMCVVDVTAYLYFVGFAPLIYVVFLHEFLSAPQSTSILFSYRSQIDEEDVSLPNQATINYNPAIDSIDDAGNSYDSTHFNNSPGQNPLCPGLNIRPEISFGSDRYDSRWQDGASSNKFRNIPT